MDHARVIKELVAKGPQEGDDAIAQILAKIERENAEKTAKLERRQKAAEHVSGKREILQTLKNRIGVALMRIRNMRTEGDVPPELAALERIYDDLHGKVGTMLDTSHHLHARLSAAHDENHEDGHLHAHHHLDEHLDGLHHEGEKLNRFSIQLGHVSAEHQKELTSILGGIADATQGWHVAHPANGLAAY